MVHEIEGVPANICTAEQRTAYWCARSLERQVGEWIRDAVRRGVGNDEVTALLQAIVRFEAASLAADPSRSGCDAGCVVAALSAGLERIMLHPAELDLAEIGQAFPVLERGDGNDIA